MAPPCRHKACSADNRRCGLCFYNPKKRCTQGCNIAVKQIQKQRLEAPCQAQIKVALYTAQACDAESSAFSWPPSSADHDLSNIVVKVRFNNIDCVFVNQAQHEIRVHFHISCNGKQEISTGHVKRRCACAIRVPCILCLHSLQRLHAHDKVTLCLIGKCHAVLPAEWQFA